VTLQVELVSHEVQILFVFRLTGVVLLPAPLLLQLLREGISVGFALGIEATARVTIPIPGAADPLGILETLDIETRLTQPINGIESGDAGADHDRVILFNRAGGSDAGRLAGGDCFRRARHSGIPRFVKSRDA